MAMVVFAPVKNEHRTVAWIVCTKVGVRGRDIYYSEYYGVPQEKRTFRTLKAAKAYAGVGRD